MCKYFIVIQQSLDILSLLSDLEVIEWMRTLAMRSVVDTNDEDQHPKHARHRDGQRKKRGECAEAMPITA